MGKSGFKQEHPFEKRKAEAERIREKYPDRVPIILEKAEKSNIPDIDKKKFLVPGELTVTYFLMVIRKRIKLTPEMGLFLFVNNTLPRVDSVLSAVYKEHKDPDGFLYFTYGAENTFGGIDYHTLSLSDLIDDC